MMNGIVIRYVCLLILSLLLQTWNYLVRLSQELQLVSVLPRRFMDVGELIGETTIEKAGLLSPDLFKVYPHFVNAYEAVYKIADNVTDWYRAPIMVLYNDSASTSLDFLTFLYSPTDGILQSLKRFFIKPERVKYYKKGRDIFVSFTYDGTQPNHAYILSPHGVQLVGTPDIIDDSFTEITETL